MICCCFLATTGFRSNPDASDQNYGFYRKVYQQERSQEMAPKVQNNEDG